MRLAWMLAALTLGVAVLVLMTGTGLPSKVATYFGPGGHPSRWMAREPYLTLVLALILLVPALMAASTGVVPRRYPHWLRRGFRESWLTGPRRETTLASMSSFGLAFTALALVLLVLLHTSVVLGHQADPPRLDGDVLLWTMLVVCGGLAALVIAAAIRFRTPR